MLNKIEINKINFSRITVEGKGLEGVNGELIV